MKNALRSLGENGAAERALAACVAGKTHTVGTAGRFTLTNRTDNLALDLFDRLIAAQYTRNRKRPIMEANVILDKLRVLLRIAYKPAFFPNKQYECAIRKIDKAGRMLGAWEKVKDVG